MMGRLLAYIKRLTQEKRGYRQTVVRVKALPEEYGFVFQKIQRYMWRYAAGSGMDMTLIHADLLDLFEAGAADGKQVLEITGEDVATFCDELLRNVKTHPGNWREAFNQDILKKLGVTKLPDYVITVEELTKSFKTTEVLKGVNLQVGRGEIFALLGSNGAGKTTIIKILSTLLRPDSGHVSVCGFDVVQQPDLIRENISLTGQFAAVDDILTGRENLILIAKLRGVDDPVQTADSLLDRFGLNDAANRRANTYSGGMSRRLDIAMSLVGTPAVIFLDEPTTGLDPEGRLEVWKTVKELAQSGTTVMLTTQYLEEAEQLADRIAILHGGQIITCGTFEELKKQFPPAKVEYIEKQPSLEEIFLAVVGKKEDQ